ncbi:helix-turn-helix domain-containing protein [Butyricicoccus sp.]
MEENFIIIPESIYRDEQLSPRAVLLYGLVRAFSNERGFCWASNAALAERLHISKSRLSHLVSELRRHGFVRLQTDPETGVRHICPIAENNEGIANFSYPHRQKQQAPSLNSATREYKQSMSESADTPARRKRFQPPSVSEVADYCREHSLRMDAERFVDYYTANGWMAGRSRIRDWQAAARNWARREQPNTPAEPEMKFVN